MFETRSNQLRRLNVIRGDFFSRGTLSSQPANIKFKSSSPVKDRFSALFIQAGVRPPSNTSILAMLAVSALLSYFSLVLMGLAGLVLPAGILCVFIFIIRRLTCRRAERFEQDYTAFLLSLSSSIRTGSDPLMAFSQCGKLFPDTSVVAQEIQATITQIDSGSSEEEAFSRFACSVIHPDISLLRTALILSRRQGSSLGACLRRLAKVTRQRQSFRRKIRGAVAMQRLSAFGIAGCTVAVGFIQASSNPQVIYQAWNEPLGRFSLSLGLGLVLTGVIWMLHMSRSRL